MKVMYVVQLLKSRSRASNQNFYWRVIAAQNGKIELRSETYARRPHSVIKRYLSAFKPGAVKFVDMTK